jgi:hypothetical protein
MGGLFSGKKRRTLPRILSAFRSCDGRTFFRLSCEKSVRKSLKVSGIADTDRQKRVSQVDRDISGRVFRLKNKTSRKE